MSAEPDVDAQPAMPMASTEADAYRAAFHSGTTAGAYAAVESMIAAELLAGHGGDEAGQALAGALDGTAQAALLVARHSTTPTTTGPHNQTVAVGRATRLLTVGSPLVLYDTDEVTCRPLRSLADEELYTVHVGTATGLVLCARPGCATCESAPARLRCRAAGYLCGVSKGAIDAAVQHVKTRVQFGRPIGHNQAVAFQLAALAARLKAMHALGEQIATQIGVGAEPLQHASWLLAACAELAVDAATTSLHLHGASGLLVGHDAQLYYRKACVFSVRHGTPAQLRLAHSTRKRSSR